MAFDKTNFKSTNGNTNVSAYIWTPDSGQVRGVVQVIHGMREHMGRYAHFAAFMNENGYVVYGDDHLGHGDTVPKGGLYGHFGKYGGENFLVSDCLKLTSIIKNRYPNAPFFLLGHSMGSFIGRIYITKYGSGLSGFICMGTGGPNPLAKAGLTLASLLSKAGLGKKEGMLMDKIAFGKFNVRFITEESEHSWLSRDKETHRQFEDDVHTKRYFTNEGFRDMLRLNIAANSKSWYDSVPKDLPLLIVSGSDDPVGDYGNGVEQVRNGLQEAGVERLDFKLYDGARHEILNETNRDEVFKDILDWMNKTKSEKHIISGETVHSE